MLPAAAEEGVTTIKVFFRVKAIRVKPSPGITESDVDFKIRMLANGKVEDNFDIKGSINGKSKSSLGRTTSKTHFKVIDPSTIARISDAGNYINTTTIKVTGKNCDATIERKLKKGESVFRSANGKEFYSSIDNQYIACVIE